MPTRPPTRRSIQRAKVEYQDQRVGQLTYVCSAQRLSLSTKDTEVEIFHLAIATFFGSHLQVTIKSGLSK